MFIFITYLTSLAIAAVAAYYSIIGLTAIFAASFWPVVIMASVLEIGKLVTASWLYQYWKPASFFIKLYLTIAVVVLMCITSMGIFGFLSKAHLEQTMSGGNNEIRIESLERRIENEENRVESAELVISQLDASVQALIDYDRIRGADGAIAVRESQTQEREKLSGDIDSAYSQIELYQDELLPLQQATIALAVEVGPLKYIADLIYGEEESASHLDEAVRWVIIMLVSVFDPLAVVLLIAANMAMTINRKDKVQKEPARKQKSVTLNTVDVDFESAPSLAFTKKQSSKSVVIDEDNILYNDK